MYTVHGHPYHLCQDVHRDSAELSALETTDRITLEDLRIRFRRVDRRHHIRCYLKRFTYRHVHGQWPSPTKTEHPIFVGALGFLQTSRSLRVGNLDALASLAANYNTFFSEHCFAMQRQVKQEHTQEHDMLSKGLRRQFGSREALVNHFKHRRSLEQDLHAARYQQARMRMISDTVALVEKDILVAKS